MRNVYLKLNYRAIPYLDFRKKKFVFKNSEQGVIDVSERIKKVIEGDAGLALIFGKLRDLGEDYSEIGEEYYDYYIPLKARLFRSNVLSQNFLLGKYLSEGKIDYKTIKFAVSNVVYDIFSKLGVKFIALEESIPYDYIMGVDVGYGEVYTGRVAGCTTIHDSEGRLRNIIPISKANLPSKETARIKALLEYIESSRIYDIEFKNKNILILRDGKIQQDEIEQLADFSEKRNCKIVLISVRKNTLYQVFGTNLNAFYIDLEDFYLLKAHKSKVGFSRPIKITQKVVIDKSNVSYERLTEDDIHLIYKLTALNYSFIGKISNLRTPSPIHYADKFVKAIKKGWSIEEKFLKEGLLYFI